MIDDTAEVLPFNPPDARVNMYAHTPRLELRQIRYFLAVAEELNFTRAADRLGMAQPPLSQQILALEHQLRVQLFERSRRHVALTREGEAFVVYARRLANTTQLAAEVVQAIARGEDGPLAVGAIFSSIYAVIPRVVPVISRAYPKIKLHLQEMTISEQLAALREDRIDLGLVRGPLQDPQMETLTLFEEPFVAVVHKNSALAQHNTLGLDQIAKEPLIRVYPSANRDYSRRMFSALVDKGFELNVVQEVSDTHTLIGLVAAGMGISLVPASLQNIQINQIRYIPLREVTPMTAMQFIWRQENTSAILANVVALIRQIKQTGIFADDGI